MNYLHELNKIALDIYEENFINCNEKEQEFVLQEYNYQLLNDNIWIEKNTIAIQDTLKC